MTLGNMTSGFVLDYVDRFLERSSGSKFSTLTMQIIDGRYVFEVAGVSGSIDLFIDGSVVKEYKIVCRDGVVVRQDDGFTSDVTRNMIESGESFVRFLSDFGVRSESNL